MEEKHSGEQPSTQEAQKKALADAVRLVNSEITAAEKRLRETARTEEGPPVMVEGRTSTGHDARVMADAGEIAKIMLSHHCHLWSTLRLDAPEGVRMNIAEMVGLKDVLRVGIILK